MNFNKPRMGIVDNPLTHSLFVDDFSYLAAPTPPGGEELTDNDGEILLDNDGEILIDNGV